MGRLISILLSVCTCAVCVQSIAGEQRTKLTENIVKACQRAYTVTRYHSMDKEINRAYDALEQYKVDKNPAQAAIAVEVMGGILDAFTHFKGNPDMNIEISFFAREKFFKMWQELQRLKLCDKAMNEGMAVCLTSLDMIQERGANNRSANFAIGALEAAKAFPKDRRAKDWRAYAEAVWNDWYVPGDSYEPGYVMHNLPRLIALGSRLGKTKELQGEKLRKTFYRYRDHVSPSGLACQPGDGEPYSQSDYAAALAAAMEVAPDSTILWALKKAYMGGTLTTGRRTEADFAKAYPQYAAMKAVAPQVGAAIQCSYPDTYKSPDRMILAPSRQDGAPYAAFWIQDDCNYLYHGGQSDTRGDLYHYEVDGVMMMADRGRYEFPGWANTLVVADADHEFPLAQTAGVRSGRWYRGSANLRVARAYMPSEKYYVVKGDNANHFGLQSADAPYGYTWGNPDALAGANDELDLKEVKLEFALLPVAGEASVGKVFEGRTWWGGYEMRNVCPSDTPVELLISDLTISGAAGEKIVVPFDKITDNISFGFIAPDAKQKFAQSPLPASATAIVTDPETGKKALKITTQYGRTVLKVKVNEKFNLTKDYSRIDLSYKYLTPIYGWTRVPIHVGINGSNVQNNIVFDDTRQGGIMTESKAYNRAGDSYGQISYRAIWTHDSKWTRRTLLTSEGIMLVIDQFTPGKRAAGKVAGAVWHLPGAPQCGNADASTAQWFDASMLHSPANTRSFTDKFGEATKHLFVTFKSPLGYVNGIQYQPKHWFTDDYAVYSKVDLEADKEVCMLSVLIPHDANLPASKIGVLKRGQGLKITEATPGKYRVELRIDDKSWGHKPLRIDFDNQGQWRVDRLSK